MLLGLKLALNRAKRRILAKFLRFDGVDSYGSVTNSIGEPLWDYNAFSAWVLLGDNGITQYPDTMIGGRNLLIYARNVSPLTLSAVPDESGRFMLGTCYDEDGSSKSNNFISCIAQGDYRFKWTHVFAYEKIEGTDITLYLYIDGVLAATITANNYSAPVAYAYQNGLAVSIYYEGTPYQHTASGLSSLAFYNIENSADPVELAQLLYGTGNYKKPVNPHNVHGLIDYFDMNKISGEYCYGVNGNKVQLYNSPEHLNV